MMSFRPMVLQELLEELKIFLVFHKRLVLIEFKFSLNRVEFSLDKAHTLIIRFFVVLLGDYLKFLFYAFFERGEEFSGDVSYRLLLEDLNHLIFYLPMNIF